VKGRFAIDPRRVYLFGHSGGAGHVLLLGLLESEYFAAVAAHAGALRNEDAPLLDVPKRKMPFAIWIGTKDQLVIAVLDEANRQLLARQQQMYRGPGGFAAKWAEARRFYEADLASGFVRVQAELWAASFANAGLREKFVPRILAWKEVVLGGVRDALRAYEASGGKLPPFLTAEVIASWISEFWLGMEFADLLGASEDLARHRAALDAMQELLERLDARAAKRGAPRTRRARHPRRPPRETRRRS
jgi:hypothetical protein